MNKIIAIVGMCGSGKSIATDILVSKGYEKVYFGGVTMDKLKEENLEVNPQNEKMMREKLRRWIILLGWISNIRKWVKRKIYYNCNSNR